MKVFNVADRVEESGEYILGYDETGTHACYMIYGTMSPGEKNRLIKPGKGHEEILMVVRGEFRLSGDCETTLKEGQAVHVVGEEVCFLENLSTSKGVYIIAGGHSEGGHH